MGSIINGDNIFVKTIEQVKKEEMYLGLFINQMLMSTYKLGMFLLIKMNIAMSDDAEFVVDT